MMSCPVFSLHYFGHIYYYAEIQKYSDIFIETQEYYVKQSFRNRHYILTANGIMPLIVPVVHRSSKERIYQKEICYKEKWYKKHETAIISAYRHAPFFEHYADVLLAHLKQPSCQYLFELNIHILQIIFSVLHISTHLHPTNEYLLSYKKDYRSFFYPHQKVPAFLETPYLQVFSDRFPFQQNLSILDLLFNLGPYAKEYILGQFSL